MGGCSRKTPGGGATRGGGGKALKQKWKCERKKGSMDEKLLKLAKRSSSPSKKKKVRDQLSRHRGQYGHPRDRPTR